MNNKRRDKICWITALTAAAVFAAWAAFDWRSNTMAREDLHQVRIAEIEVEARRAASQLIPERIFEIAAIITIFLIVECIVIINIAAHVNTHHQRRASNHVQ